GVVPPREGRPGPPPMRGPNDGGFRDRPPRRPPPDRDFRPPAQVASMFDSRETNFYYIVWQADGQLQGRSTNAPPELSMPPREQSGQFARTRGTMREFVRFTSLDRCVLI